MQDDKANVSGDRSAPPGLPPFSGSGPAEQDFGIRIARDGTWFHNGDPIRRIELAKLFSTVLRRDEAGGYWLVTPVERGRIVVEDVPFVAVEMTARGSGEDQILAFRTNLDEWVEAGPDHPIRVVHNADTGEPTPYLDVRQGLEARIGRSVYYEMVDRCAMHRDRAGPAGQEAEVGVWSNGRFFALGGSAGA